jgi:hypothetical protein
VNALMSEPLPRTRIHQRSLGVDRETGSGHSLSLEGRLWITRSRRGRSFWERFVTNVVSTSNPTADKRSSSARAIWSARPANRSGRCISAAIATGCSPDMESALSSGDR